jgi:HD-GYP domain-containing protein (c-di-GMP phosphodiesterase class II)
MISIPQYLEFPSTGKTKEICEFFLQMLERKNKSLYLHSQQVANYAACIAAQLGLSPREIKTIKTGALAARYRSPKRAQRGSEQGSLFKRT